MSLSLRTPLACCSFLRTDSAVNGTPEACVPRLSQNIADLIDQPFVLEVLRFDPGQLLKQLALFARQTCRRDHRYGNEEIPFASTAEHRHSLPAYSEHCSGLRPGWNLQRLIFIERFDVDFSSQRCLGKGDRDRCVQVISRSEERRVGKECRS